jgi:hypothetical protein
MDLEEIEEAATAVVAIERKPHAGKGKPMTESQKVNLALGRAKRAGMKAAKAEEEAVKQALVTKKAPPPPPPSPEPVKRQLVKPRQRKAEPEPEPEPEPVKKKKKKQVIIVEADSSSDDEPQIIYKTKPKKRATTPPAPLYEEPPEIPRLRRA